MKKSLTSLLAALLGLGSVSAAELTPAQALARVKGNSQARKVIGSRNLSPQLIAELPELYVFSSGTGFMILPANDVALPLLGYADSGEFNPEQNPALKWWLSTYSEQIAAAASTDIYADDASTAERKPVEPLLKTIWNQDSPFNDLAPELYGRKCYTGCVATAMAQVMKYHKWPEKGQGSVSYAWKSNGDQTLSMDFSEVTFDWVNMLDSYNAATSEAADLAVATLMKACGYSVKMDYSTLGSGADPALIGGALLNNFDYDQGIWQPKRNYYELAEWETLIYDELAAGRPVIYFGQSPEGGHQFVCDGYSTDGFFHFNWGWGGMSDGYFKLNALNPSAQGIGGADGGYNQNQSVVVGIQPPVEGSKPVYMLSSSNDLQVKNETVVLGGYVIFTFPVTNTGALTIPNQSEIDIELSPTDGGDPTYIKCLTLYGLEPTVSTSDLYALIPSTLTEGTYTARIVFKVPGGEWQPVLFPLSNNRELTATVKDSKISFVAENEPGFTITDLPEDKTIYIGTTFSLNMTLTNKTATEYVGSMFPRIIKKDSDDLIGWGSNVNVQLTGDETMPFEYVGSLTPETNVTLEPGEYRLYFYSQESKKAICDPIPITLAERPAKTSIEVTDFKFEGMQPGDIAKFTWTVTCTEGYYNESMTLYILDGAGKMITYRSVSPYLNAGESMKCTIEVPFNDREFGYYSGALYYDNKRQNEASFSYLEHTTLIEEVTSEAADAAVYDLQGRRVIKPAPGHIYIMGNKLIRF